MRVLTTKQGYSINVEAIDDMLTMKLHDSVRIDIADGYTITCTRVYNGWIYHHRHGNAGIEMVFVGES